MRLAVGIFLLPYLPYGRLHPCRITEVSTMESITTAPLSSHLPSTMATALPIGDRYRPQSKHTAGGQWSLPLCGRTGHESFASRIIFEVSENLYLRVKFDVWGWNGTSSSWSRSIDHDPRAWTEVAKKLPDGAINFDILSEVLPI